MKWANFLHIYQPPDQKKDLINEIVIQSYRPIINILKENPRAKLTLNIAACLSEQLLHYGYKDVIDNIKDLVQKKQIELTESSKFHAFLSLLPESEIERQIKLNHESNKNIFGELYKPRGFHLPELAYHRKIAEIAANLGYQWIILNETSFAGKLFSKIDTTQIYCLKNLPKFKLFFRSRRLSDLIQRGHVWLADNFIKEAKKDILENEYFITAIDGETFGHHRPGLEKFLKNLYESKEIEFTTVSELENFFPATKEIEPVNSSWGSLESEIAAGIPYTQWNYPGNIIHEKQWEFTYLTIDTIEKHKNDPDYEKAREILDKALFSCQYWWAGAVPWWEVEYIEKGAYMLRHAIESLSQAPAEIKEKAKSYYSDIVFTAFDWERSGKAHEDSMAYTKKIRRELGEDEKGVSAVHSKR